MSDSDSLTSDEILEIYNCNDNKCPVCKKEIKNPKTWNIYDAKYIKIQLCSIYCLVKYRKN